MRRACDVATIFAFVAAVFTGMAVTAANIAGVPDVYQRVICGQSWKKVPTSVETIVNEQLAGRAWMTEQFGRFKFDVCDTSPTPRATVGRDGWLFFRHDADAAYLRPGDPKLAARLQTWTEATRSRSAWLARRGATYLLAIAPDKQSVYADKLPPSEGVNWRVRPIDSLPAGSFLDLREPLRHARAAEDVYLLRDTHWNAAGVFAGYSAILRSLRVDPRSRGEFREWLSHWASQDVLPLMGLPERDDVSTPMLELTSPRRTRLSDEKPNRTPEMFTHLQPRVWHGESGPRVMLLHDSFADDLFQSWLAEHCSRLIALPTYTLHRGVAERERPDVVILLAVERMLQGHDLTP